MTTEHLPPGRDLLDGKVRRISTLTDIHIAAVVCDIIHAIRHGLAQRILLKIVRIDRISRLTAAPTGIFEGANPLFFLGIDAEDG